MNLFFRKVAAWAAVLCLLLTPMTTAAKEVILIGDSGFEATNSYLTHDQYEGLGLHLGSAASADRNETVDLLADFSSKYKLEETRYGWSNPQVIAVMLSSPYWDELDYGADMTAAGSTSFSLSTGVETGDSAQMNLALGLSFSASATAEVFGNGGEIGGELSGMLSKAVEVQSSKASNKILTFQAGAGDDHVALVVFPMASYKYSYKTDGGQTEYLYANVQLEPVSTVTTLDNYNLVAREHNMTQQTEATMLPVMDMYYIAPQYEKGDPSTYFANKEDFPSYLVFENGKLMVGDADASAEDRLTGSVYAASTAYSVAVGQADTGAEMTYEVSQSEGSSHSLGVSLGASIYGEISEGVDIGVVETSFSQRLTVSGELGVAVSHAILDTRSTSYSVGFVNLPASAQTGVTGTGVATSDYAFNASLALWIPTERGDNLSIAPLIVGAIVDFADPEAMPLYLPDDVHMDSADEESVTLAWTNPDYNAYPFNKRRPAKFEVATITSIDSGDVYTVVKTVDASEQSITLTGLQPATEYTYALRAYDGASRRGVYGAPVSASTLSSDAPDIVRQPMDITVSVGEAPVLQLAAVPADISSSFSYQWYQLQETRYGYTWNAIYGATQASFNAAYFEEDGLVNPSNRYKLNNTVYRCVVMEKRDNVVVTAVSSAAKVKIADRYYVRTYDDLREIALNIQNGNKEVAGYCYVLDNDITCPEDETWSVPIGSVSVPFSGSFNGQGYTISGLNAKADDGRGGFGLFAALSGATVKDLHLKDVSVDTHYAHTGGIAGQATDSVVSGCTVSGSVHATSAEGGHSVGGIVGYATGNTRIERCINYGSVSGQLDAVGGIVGQNFGTVFHCANQGDLQAHCPYYDHEPMSGYVGGVVGRNRGSVSYCYNVGSYSIDNRQISHASSLCNQNGAENSYFLNSVSTATGRTAAQFASGLVAYELNLGSVDGEPIWYQSIDNEREPDAYPHLTAGDDMMVYQLADGESYSNYPSIGATRPSTDIGVTTTSTTDTTSSTTETTMKTAKTTATTKLTATSKSTTTKPTAVSTTTSKSTTKPVTTAATPDTPKTGDGSQTIVWLVVALAAAVIVGRCAARHVKVH